MMVSPSRPLSLSVLHHRADDVVELRHAGFLDDQPFSEVRIVSYFSRQVGHDVHARRVEPEEERLAVLAFALSTNLSASSRISSSTVSIRFGQSAPASSIFCLPILPQRGCSVVSSTCRWPS